MPKWLCGHLAPAPPHLTLHPLHPDIMEHTNTKNFTISNVHYGGQPDRWWESCNQTVRECRCWDGGVPLWDAAAIPSCSVPTGSPARFSASAHANSSVGRGTTQ